MTDRMIAACFTLIIAVFGAPRGRTQSNEPAQAAAAAPLPAPVQRILTKDPQYMKLLSPPLGNDFLQTYSKGYREKSAEIEASVAGISDENLRGQARKDEWAGVLKNDRDKFTNEGEVALNDAKISFSRAHRDGFFDVGRFTYDEINKTLAVNSYPTAPIEANFRVVINGATINQIYDKFRQIAGQDIEQKTREYVSKAGVGSTCSRNPDWCYKFGIADMERSLRSERLVVVAQGDLADQKIDRLFLVDYKTEAVLLEFDPHISTLNNPAWRFSVGMVPAMPTEPQSTETQVQPAAAASTEPGRPTDEHTEDATGGNAPESTSSAPNSSSIPPTRLRVPGKVTAAAIVS